VVPDGQANVPVKPPPVTDGAVPELLTLLNELQSEAVLYPKVTDPLVTSAVGVATGAAPDDGATSIVILEPVTVIVVPADPDVGLLVIVPPAVRVCNTCA